MKISCVFHQNIFEDLFGSWVYVFLDDTCRLYLTLEVKELFQHVPIDLFDLGQPFFDYLQVRDPFDHGIVSYVHRFEFVQL